MAAEEARAPLADADQRIPSVHFTGFTGRLLALDCCLFNVVGICYVLLLLVLLGCGALIWFTTLAVAAGLILVSTAAERGCSRGRGLGERSVLRFVYTIPIAFISLYAAAVAHGPKASCPWYVQLDRTKTLMLLVFLYPTGCLAVLSIVLGALKIDCNASPSVSRRVNTRRYLLCHVLFRTSEISFRLITGIILCECLRVLGGALPWIPSWHVDSMPLFLCVPFAVLVMLYMRVLAVAGRSANRSPDSWLSSLVVALVTLFMNPMHFFERPGFGKSVQDFNKWLFIIRSLELCLTLGLLFWTAKRRSLPKGLCTDNTLSSWDLLRYLGPFVWCQLVVSFLVHYMVMALNNDIKHSTCQRLSRATEQTPNAMVFTGDVGSNDLYVPPPPSRGSLCEAWVAIGGSLPFADFPEERPLGELVEYRLLERLGSGSYGVVVKMQKVAEGVGESKCLAVKLLNTHAPGHNTLAQREARLYTKIWLSINDLSTDVTPPADDLMPKAGHPFIVRLLFWSQWDSERIFYLVNQEEVVSEVTGTRHFSMALVMELCDSNLEKYLASHFRRDVAWFRTLVHFLAEIQLALAFLHRTNAFLQDTNVAYRDLKPENVLIVVSPRDGQVHCKLADFGFARELDPQADQKVKTRAGTPYFFAPEVETGKSREQALENAVDVFSYGSLAYALGHGPGYCREGNATGKRGDHPRCHNCPVGISGASRNTRSASSSGNCCCAGCRNVANLQRKWEEEFRGDAGRQLADLITSCVDDRPQARPSMQSLQQHELFQHVDFKQLLQVDI